MKSIGYKKTEPDANAGRNKTSGNKAPNADDSNALSLEPKKYEKVSPKKDGLKNKKIIKIGKRIIVNGKKKKITGNKINDPFQKANAIPNEIRDAIALEIENLIEARTIKNNEIKRNGYAIISFSKRKKSIKK